MSKNYHVVSGRLFPPGDGGDDDNKDDLNPPVDGDNPPDLEGDKKTYTQEEFVEMQNKFKKDIAALRKKSKETPSTDPSKDEEIAKRDRELKELKESLKRIEDEREEHQLKNKDEKDKELFQANKKIRELESLVSELSDSLKEKDSSLGELGSKFQTQLKNLREQTLESEIFKAAEAHNALRPQQIVGLTKKDFIWDDDLERWIVPTRNKKGDIVDGKDVKEYIKEYLTAEENDNLVRAGVKTGTGEKPTSSFTAPGNSTDKNKQQKVTVKIDDKLRKEAEMRDMKEEDWAELKQFRLDTLEAKKNKNR